MRLKQLKLAGFKSFVDPTPIPFPSQLVAVVGPNGCGKSNVMDSVRWVMGESSAKNLRSESMADVIFNGSTNRKPIGQASVELIFENDKGRLSGQYANYQEVSIKRLVTRAGESSYFLNGTRCRRRDINDLFLGTGAGARGYAIIGQDMISRLIEARPEELRAYLEEAAGVSKYKERRRETCNRIKHTQENLERVNDIIDEMNKQLEKLERQAKTAEKYKKLKEQERNHQVELLGIKWLTYDEIKRSTLSSIQHHDTTKNEILAQITHLEKETQLEQQILFDVELQLSETQEKYYILGREITRLETTLEQHQKERKRLITELESLESENQNIHITLQENQRVVDEHADTLEQLESQKKEINTKFESLSANVKNKEIHLRQEQEQWRSFKNEKQQIGHSLEKKQLQEEHLVSRHQDVMVQLETTDIEDLRDSIEAEEIVLSQLLTNQQHIQKEYTSLEETCYQETHQLKSLKQSLADEQLQLQQANSQRLALQTEFATEKAALEASSQESCDEFKKSRWHTYPRLFDALEVEKGWEKIVEWVLGEGIEAVVIESLNVVKEEPSELASLTASFVTSVDNQHALSEKKTLSSKLNGLIPNWLTHLNEVFIADTDSEAMEMLDTVKPHQSVITQQGFWVGQGWLKIKNFNQENKPGILKRKNNMQLLEAKLDENKRLIEKIESCCDKKLQRIDEVQRQVDETQEKLMCQHRELTEIKAKTNQVKLKIDDKKTSLEKTNDHYQLLTNRLEELSEEQQLLSDEISKLQTKLETYQSLEKDKQDKLSAIENDYQQLNDQLLQLNEKKQAHDLLTEKQKLQYAQLKDRITQGQEQLARINDKKIKIEKLLAEDDSSDEKISKPLKEKHQLYLELEQQIQLLKEKSQDIQEKINAHQENLRQIEKTRDTLNEKQQVLQIELQKAEVNLSNLTESLNNYHKKPESVIQTLSSETNQDMLQQELEQIQERIKRLGAINLVAIDEYQESQSRKKHLDAQHADLVEALSILEKAIQKMDKETESRFKATFEEVNASFQRLFPKLFGGGRAKLNLTCDNLLEAGVVVTAQPPGKKNSTIYMLSGGEKSMTAIALVFSIFQLNPAPFCLLDEVDAPLDEANVRRFCNMVKEMSEYVQFLFITHNKVTMELAEQLIGVTMREPGVSRIVAVDMEEALGYAQT